MPDVKIDRITVLEGRERDGILLSLTRVAEVSGITDSSWAALQTALDEAGVPKYGARPDGATQGSDAYELFLVERNPRVVEKGRCRVELIYEHSLSFPDDMDAPRLGFLTGEVRCNVQQKSSNLDINGNQVVVAHTYPADDPNHPGETLTQGGEFQYYEAQRSFMIRGLKQTTTPWLIANSVVGSLNESGFSGEPARTWLCIAGNWRAQGIHGGQHKYYMEFEFQQDPDGWDPTVVYIDDVTGKPPPNLVPGVGYKTVTKLRQVDFEQMIGTLIQGA